MAHAEAENTVEAAAQAAMDAAEELLRAYGGSVETLYIALLANGIEGEENACTAAIGDSLPDDEVDRAKHLLAFLIGHASGLAKALGLELKVAPLGRG